MHAYIISGDAQHALDAAWEKAKAVLCESEGPRPCGRCRQCLKAAKRIHPDVTFINREEDDKGRLCREILVAQIRALERDALVLPNDARTKVYIFPEADAMNENAQNAFLKLLEEPPEFVTFLLCTENRNGLLETVRSRCGEIRAGAEEKKYSEEAVARAEEYLKNLHKRVELWSCCVAMEGLDNPALMETIACIRELAISRVQNTRELLALEEFLAKAEGYGRGNVGLKHITGYLSTYTYEE